MKRLQVLLLVAMLTPLAYAPAGADGYDPVAGSAIAQAAITPLDLLGCNANLRRCDNAGHTPRHCHHAE